MIEKIKKMLKNEDFNGMLGILCGKKYLDNILSIKESLKGKKGLALDIDDTLSATNIAWFEIFFEKFGNPEGLSSHELEEKYGLCQNCPTYQKQEIYDLMHDLREDNDFQEGIPLIGESNKIYKELHDNHAEILLYITARPHTVKSGTEKWLEKHHFPKAEIIFRPQELDHQYSNIWKAALMNILYPEISGIVDDNDTIREFLGEDYKGKIYVFGGKKEYDDTRMIPLRTHEEIFNRLTFN